VNEGHVWRAEISDDQVRAMLDVFAGPASPQPPAGVTRRRATRRTVIVLVAGLVALGLAVPGALALFGYWETPKQFLADPSQPAYAKRFVRQWLTSHYANNYFGPRPVPIRLVALTRGVTAGTPTGDIRAYVLRIAGGTAVGRGTAIAVFIGRYPRDAWVYFIPMNKAQTGEIEKDWYHPCPHGWALQYLEGPVTAPDRIGRTVGWTFGRAASRVASVHVLYRDGSTTRGAVKDGYFVAWMKPSAAWTNVTVIGENAAGNTIARLVVGGYGGKPFWSVKPGRSFACAP
jgi:hypothetical protein